MSAGPYHPSPYDRSFVERVAESRPNGTHRNGSFVSRVRPRDDRPLFDRILDEPAPDHSTALDRSPATNGTHQTRNGSPEPPTGEKAKARDLIAAIRTLKQIEREQRPATTDERDILARFGGFGPVALSIFPNPVTGQFKEGWSEIGGELKALLTPEEYDSAKRTTFSQFFTSPLVMRAMHEAIERLGVPANGIVLEPGCGTARFMTGAHRYIGVELDSLTGRIARALHPDADIRIENFRDSKLPPLDAVIGNVPFANVHLDFHGQKLALHDFCITKSVEALKPGGVLAVVTSHFTLDKQNASVREMIAEQADFLGAIRLPCDAFKREGTEVTTDILFLRKRAPGQEPNHADPEWLETSMLGIAGADLPVNRYFCDHHDMVLGDWSRDDTLYGSGFSVKPNGNLASQLSEAVGKIAGVEQSVAERPNPPPSADVDDKNVVETAPPFVPPPPLRHITEGSLFVGDDKVIYQLEDGSAQPVTYCGVLLRSDGTLQARKIGSLIGLRDLARRVLQSQNEGWPEANRAEARRALNYAYDRFFSQYGPINKTTFTETRTGQIRRMPNLVKFREDPDAMLVMSLEEYDEATGKAEKAAIMKRDVVGPKPPVTHVTSAEEGLLVSLNERGGVDLPFITGLYGKSEQAIVAELGDLIFENPEGKKFEVADDYLSGNVRHKLAVAEKAGPEYTRNAEALRQVQPEDVLPGDIDANLGAPWIPPSDIRQFAAELFNVPPEAFKVEHLKKDAVWSLEPDYLAVSSVAATADFGTGRINGTELLSLALNLKTPVIYDTIRGPNGDERVLNPTETQAAKEKQKLIKERFKTWIFSDPDRTERLVRVYNDTYNNLRPRLFDGSHLDFPGMSKAVELRPHQKDAVWRAMTGGNTLLAHTVGAGKTNVCVAAAMKMKQAGLIKKPLICCPNHMLEQFSREWLQLYPNAKILVASKEDFTKERRKALTAKIATGDWDGIIVTHSSFERIGMSKEFQERFLRDQIADYESLLIDKASAGRNIIKLLEKQKASREEKLKNLLAEDKKDDGLTFDELGIDQLMVDECFTHDTLVETDQGPMKIGDVVTSRRHVNLKSLNLSTNALEWRPVVNWFPNKRKGELVEVVHEAGSFICTPRHKLWVRGKGYKKAGEVAAGEELLVLRPGVYSELGEGRAEAQVLQSAMQDRRAVDNQDMRELPAALLLRHDQPSQRDQAAEAVLQRELQNEGPEGESGDRGSLERIHAALVGQPVLEGEEQPYCLGENEGRQPDVERRDPAEDVAYPSGYRAQAPHSWRKRASDRAAETARGENRHGHGVGHPHEADQAPHGEPGKALQGGFGRSGEDAGRGTGRGKSSVAESEGEGREEGQGLVASRVVSVTVLEPGSDGEYRFGGRDHSVVYDIEVEGNHNYFANGVLVSNCHAFKNLETPTKMDRVAGIQTGGSERAFDLLMKAKYLDEKHPGHGLIGASGTPISNSMVEMYTMQRYFDPAGLKDRGIEHFDAWAATFGEVVDSMEISPDGASLRPRSRFAKFVNLPELVQMFRAFADVQTAEMLDLPRPKLEGGKPQTIACPMSDEQRDLQANLIKRYDRIRNEKVDPREDNALAITTDGRKLALDGRMLQPGLDFPESKINALVRNVTRIWRQTEEKRGTQMVFCDMGVNPTPWGFSAYDEIVEKLVDHGIPRGQIAIVGDADTDAKKQALFEKVRQGTVRVLLGSTSKMGTGTNVQKRLVALHHLDAPWKPAEVEQRDGRILRQGNDNPEVAIYRYVTEGSFDAYMWQALETKARFIAQVMSGDCAVRKAEDVGGQELSYAEVKAIASGNPAVLTLAEADAELQRLAILRKNHLDEQYQARRSVRDLPDEIRRLEKRLEGLTTDKATVEANKSIPSQEAVAERMRKMPERVSETYRTRLGTYRGLECGMILHPLGGAEVYLDGVVRRREQLLRDNPGPRAVLNALERLADGYDSERRKLKAEIGVKRGQFTDYETRLDRPYVHADYMSQLTDLRDQLKEGLSEKAQQEPTPEGPSVSELAEQIKALRESNTVEAAPERAVRKAARAERPVTARIRAKLAEAGPEPVQPEEPVADDLEPTHEAILPPPSEPIVASPPVPAKPLNVFQQKVALYRQSKPTQLTLF